MNTATSKKRRRLGAARTRPLEKAATGAAKLRRRLQGSLLRQVLLLAAALFSVVLAGAILLDVVFLADDPKDVTSMLLRWAALFAATSCAALGAGRWGRAVTIERRIRANLDRRFPEQRRELETWLSDELIGERAAAVRVLTENRLDNAFRGVRRVPVQDGPHGVMMTLALTTVLFLALASFTAGSPIAASERFVHGLFALDDGIPPTIVSIVPETGWVEAGGLNTIAIEFDRPPRDAEIVVTRAGEELAPIPLERGLGGKHRARLEDIEAGDVVAITVRANRRTSQAFEYRTFPSEPVVVRALHLFDPSGRKTEVITPAGAPIPIAEGSGVIFEIVTVGCPLERIGLAGADARGELGLEHLPQTNEYLAEARITEDESFQLFWQIPGHSAGLGTPVSFRCIPGPRPVVELVRPDDGEEVSPDGLPMDIVVRHPEPPAMGIIMATDYHGTSWAWRVPLDPGEPGVWHASVTLPYDHLPGKLPGVVGVRAAAVSRHVHKLGASAIVNVFAPDEQELRNGSGTGTGTGLGNGDLASLGDDLGSGLPLIGGPG